VAAGATEIARGERFAEGKWIQPRRGRPEDLGQHVRKRVSEQRRGKVRKGRSES